jgi:hypothetical protein
MEKLRLSFLGFFLFFILFKFLDGSGVLVAGRGSSAAFSFAVALPTMTLTRQLIFGRLELSATTWNRAVPSFTASSLVK